MSAKRKPCEAFKVTDRGKRGDEPRTFSTPTPTTIVRGECSDLPVRAAPQSHGRKSVVRGLPNVLRPYGYTNAKRKDVTVRISSIVWGISLLFLSMLIMVDLQGCANQKWVSQKVAPIFSARACSCGPQSGCYRCYPLEGKPVVPPGTTQVSHDRPPVPPYTPPTPITPRASLTAQSFHDSARKGDLEKMKDLVQARPELVNAKDNLGDTALYYAVALGHKAVAELLLAHKADVNAKDNRGFSPLHAAAGTGRTDLVKVLLANKADVNAKDNGGWTPLHAAAYHGEKAVVETLLVNKADIHAKFRDGFTALHLASERGHKPVVEVLLAHGADVNAKVNDGRTALLLAEGKGHKDIAVLLQKRGE